jgi:hypothetical protein
MPLAALATGPKSERFAASAVMTLNSRKQNLSVSHNETP